MKKHKQPPKYLFKWLERFCDPKLVEAIAGDLEEVFQENMEAKGRIRAVLICWVQTLGFMRGKFKKKPERVSNMKAVWTNYFLTAYRSMKKQKVFFGINLIGLVIAITCSLFALVYIYDELQFDKQHSDGDRTYRLYKRYINELEGVDHLTYETSGMMGVTMKEEFPEVTDISRMLPWWHPVIFSFEETHISAKGLHFADANFYEFFDFDVIAGNSATFLTAPASIVLTESLAKKLFPNAEVAPLGKQIIAIDGLEYTITGVVADPPRQSSFEFTALVSWSTTMEGGPLERDWMNNWAAQGIYTFVKLEGEAQPDLVVSKLPDMMLRHFEERADQYLLKLQPFEEMHLHGEDIRGTERMKSGSITFIYTLGSSAFFVFLIACVNYINISLSRASRAHTEVGIRKVMGSTRRQLTGRFLSETLIYSLLASVLSLILIYILLPFASQLSGKELPFSAFLHPYSILAILSFIVLTGLIAGLYPAWILSNPPVSTILKSGSGQSAGAGGWMKKLLLILQYAISIFLIICTFTVIKQIQFLQNKPLGFDKEQILVMDIGNEVNEHAEAMEDMLLKHPNILSISKGLSTMGNASYTLPVVPEGYTDELNARIFYVDPVFFETYGIEEMIGRSFIKNSLADSNQIIINQAMMDFMDWEDPIGKHIRIVEDDKSYPVIGVVSDFHVHSLTTSTIEPMIIRLNTWMNWYMSVRIGEGDVLETIAHVNDTWDQFATRTPFDFYFVDDWFQEQYNKERNLLGTSTIYACISLLLCGLGLYGLTALHLQHRSKEITIRKVLGATISSLVSMINRQFLVFILISVLVATPVAWYFVREWLDQFAYKISIDWTPFIYSVLLIVSVSTIIISALSVRTASVNPAKNLKAE